MTVGATSAYLDYAATAPMLPEVEEAWVAAVHALRAAPGNPAALHGGGRTAKRMLEDARERVGAALGAERAEVIFTSGATESCALGVSGAARGVRARYPQRTGISYSLADHDAVAHQESVLTAAGFDVHAFALDKRGVSLLPAGLEDKLPQTALLTMPLVCSELGTIQPLGELVARVREHVGDCARENGYGPAQEGRPLIHTDAAQALRTHTIDFASMGVDLLSFGGHKIGAPVGVGALLTKRGTPVTTDRPGGGHERGLRSGTPDVAGAVALAAALEHAVSVREAHYAHLKELRDYLLSALHGSGAASEEVTVSVERAALLREVSLTVPAEVASPAIIHLSIPTTHPEAVLMAMDMAGVMVSAGSACHAGVTRPSAMVMAMGRSADQALGVLRVSLGEGSTRADLDRFVAALPAAIRAGQALDARDVRKTAPHASDERSPR